MPAGAPVPSLVEVLNGAPPANSPCCGRRYPSPARKFRYSGGGYTIIQQLLIDVTDRPFAALLDETVLGPLGADAQQFSPAAEPQPEQHVAATPYLHEAGSRCRAARTSHPELAAAGLWTTPIRSGAI